jgi:hypothetical protein
MIMACLVYLRQRIVPDITIKIETLRILEVGIRYRVCRITGLNVVRAHPTAHIRAIVPCPEVVES